MLKCEYYKKLLGIIGQLESLIGLNPENRGIE